MIGAFTTKAILDLELFAASAIKNAALAQGAITKLTASAALPVAGGGLKGIRSAARKGQDPAQAARFAAAKSALVGGQITTAAELQAANAALVEQQKVVGKTTVAHAALGKQIESNNKILRGMGNRVKVVTG